MTEICFGFVEGCLSARLFRIIIRKLPSPKNASSYKAFFHKPEKISTQSESYLKIAVSLLPKRKGVVEPLKGLSVGTTER